jgi:hypothetical protein
MDQQTYAAMMALLEEIDGKIDDIGAQQLSIAERVGRAENSIGKLWLAVMGGGPLILTGIAYLYVIHLISK